MFLSFLTLYLAGGGMGEYDMSYVCNYETNLNSLSLWCLI